MWDDDPERRASLLDKLAAQRAAQRRAIARRAAQAEEGRARVAEREAEAADAPPAEAAAPYISRSALLQSHSPTSVAPPLHTLVAEKELTTRFKIEATTAARHIKPHSCWPTPPAACSMTPADDSGARTPSPRESSPRRVVVAAPRRRTAPLTPGDVLKELGVSAGTSAGAGAAGGRESRGGTATARPATAPYRTVAGRTVDPTRRPKLLAAGLTQESLSGTRPAIAFVAADHDAAVSAAAAVTTARSDHARTAPAWQPNTPRGDAPPQPSPRRPAAVAALPNTDGGARKPSLRGCAPRPAQVVMAHGPQSAASEQVRMIVRGLYN